MKSYLNFIPQHKKITFLLICLVIIAIFFLIFNLIQTKTIPFSPNTWQGLTPGQSNSKDVEKILGNPITLPGPTHPNSKTYPSDSQYYPHEVVFNEDRATLIIQRSLNFSEQSAVSFYQTYGEPQAIINTNLSENGLHLYIWTDVGIALLIHDQTGKIFEIWHFTPTDINDFQAKFSYYIGEFNSNHF